LRDAIARHGSATVSIDLRPDLDTASLVERLARRGRLSIGNTLRRRAGLSPEAAALVLEALHMGADPTDLPLLIKSLKLRLDAPMPIERAISSAGGIRLDAVTDRLMVRDRPGVFVAGEMLDWEAPTGGYLLQACFSTGVAAANGALHWMGKSACTVP
jgi:predicted flavoprotein YhiN